MVIGCQSIFDGRATGHVNAISRDGVLVVEGEGIGPVAPKVWLQIDSSIAIKGLDLQATFWEKSLEVLQHC